MVGVPQKQPILTYLISSRYDITRVCEINREM